MLIDGFRRLDVNDTTYNIVEQFTMYKFFRTDFELIKNKYDFDTILYNNSKSVVFLLKEIKEVECEPVVLLLKEKN